MFLKKIVIINKEKNTFIVGQSIMLSDEKVFRAWEEKYEEDILEHLHFDIFLGVTNVGLQKIKYKVFTGSIMGQKILDKFGFKNYEHIQFAGPIKEEGLNVEMIEIKDAMKKITKLKFGRN